jgi:hypothetical protein
VETFVRRLDHRSAWHRRRTCHRSPEIRHNARPFALAQHDFVRVVDEMLVRKRLEEWIREVASWNLLALNPFRYSPFSFG